MFRISLRNPQTPYLCIIPSLSHSLTSKENKSYTYYFTLSQVLPFRVERLQGTKLMRTPTKEEGRQGREERRECL